MRRPKIAQQQNSAARIWCAASDSTHGLRRTRDGCIELRVCCELEAVAIGGEMYDSLEELILRAGAANVKNARTREILRQHLANTRRRVQLERLQGLVDDQPRG